MTTYNRNSIRYLLCQPEKLGTKKPTGNVPSQKTVGLIIGCLSEVIPYIAKEFIRECPPKLKEVGINFRSVRGNFSWKLIPVCQWVLDNSNFAYLGGKSKFIDWLYADDGKAIAAIKHLYTSLPDEDPYGVITLQPITRYKTFVPRQYQLTSCNAKTC